MFELGKKYRQNSSGTQGIFVPEYIGKEQAFGVFTSDNFPRECALPHEYLKKGYYIEIREPRTITGWVNIWKDVKDLGFNHTIVYPTEEQAYKACPGHLKRVDVIKIEYTEKV